MSLVWDDPCHINFLIDANFLGDLAYLLEYRDSFALPTVSRENDTLETSTLRR